MCRQDLWAGVPARLIPGLSVHTLLDIGAEGGPATPEALYVETTGRPRLHAALRASLSLGWVFFFLLFSSSFFFFKIKQEDLSCGYEDVWK